MQIIVYVYTGQAVSGIRTFRSIRAAQAYITRVTRLHSNRRAYIHEVTR